MSNKPAELEDVLEVISDLSNMVSEGFERLGTGQAETNTHLSSVEHSQAETNTRLTSIEGRLESIEADIKELYAMITGLRKDIDEHKLHWRQLERRLDSVEAFATMLSKQTGIKFK